MQGVCLHVARTLLLYFGLYGHTRRICEAIQQELERRGLPADVLPIVDGNVDPSGYDAIVIGAAIRNGKHNPAVLDFIRRHRALLETRPSGFFSVNLVARKPAKNTPATNPYVKAFVARSPWKPRLLGVFGGNLDYQRYSAMDRNIIRFIMWLTGGPTDPQTRIEYTNWDAVRAFAGEVAAMTSGQSTRETGGQAAP